MEPTFYERGEPYSIDRLAILQRYDRCPLTDSVEMQRSLRLEIYLFPV